MFDAHTHLNSDQLYPHRKQHFADFLEAGGSGIVNIGVNHERNQRAITIAKEAPKYIEKISKDYGLGTSDLGIFATIGLHPCQVSFGHICSEQDIKHHIQQLTTVYKKEKDFIVAIGECGIDSHRERNDDIQALQILLLQKQCELAKAWDLPLVIHSRDNFSLTYEVLQEYQDLQIYFHCRGYTPEDIQQAAATFSQLWIGFCGNITYPKAHTIRDSLETILQLNETQQYNIRILLETDAPYLSPQIVRGNQNVPAHCKHLYDRAQETYNLPAELFVENAKKLYLL